MASPREKHIAQHLATKGIEFSEILRDDNKLYFRNLKATYFAVASAISLTWTKHAKFEEEFIQYASLFIDGKVGKEPNMAKQYCHRFGEEGLDIALTNYRRYYNKVKEIMPDFYRCDVLAIGRLQQRLLSKLYTLREEGFVSGIGPWLFTGPFKIILSDQDRFWKEDGIDAIVLPTGVEVDRGISKLKTEGYPFMKDFDANWLDITASSILDSYADYTMVHNFIEKIGQITSTPAIHINSALYLYGRGEI